MSKLKNEMSVHTYRPYDRYELSPGSALSLTQRILNSQITSLVSTRDELLNPNTPLSIAFIELYTKIYQEVINNKNGLYSSRVIFTGVGKNANLANKASETFASLGIPTLYLNSCHAVHGDLGLIGPNDIIIHISMSGKTAETLSAAAAITNLGVQRKSKNLQILLTGSEIKTNFFDLVMRCTGINEAHYTVKAPTSSTSVFILVLDTLGILLSETMGITEKDFHAFHPGGNLGQMYKDK